MKIAIIYDTKTNNTKKAAEFIGEGCKSNPNIIVELFYIDDAENDFVKTADGVIIGCPTYMASATAAMVKWLQSVGQRINLAGKLGGAFATEQYIHGGAENVISTILTHEMTFGMMTYSGGSAYGKPCIHLGPVGMRQNMDDFYDLFYIYGQRFAEQLTKIFDN